MFYQKCSILVLFFDQILEQFRQCGIFCFYIRFWNSSDSVVFFVFLLDFGTVPTVWYFLFDFSIRFWNSCDSVVFFVLFFYQILEVFRRCGWYSLVYNYFIKKQVLYNTCLISLMYRAIQLQVQSAGFILRIKCTDCFLE